MNTCYICCFSFTNNINKCNTNNCEAIICDQCIEQIDLKDDITELNELITCPYCTLNFYSNINFLKSSLLIKKINNILKKHKELKHNFIELKNYLNIQEDAIEQEYYRILDNTT